MSGAKTGIMQTHHYSLFPGWHHTKTSLLPTKLQPDYSTTYLLYRVLT